VSRNHETDYWALIQTENNVITTELGPEVQDRASGDFGGREDGVELPAKHSQIPVVAEMRLEFIMATMPGAGSRSFFF
jgi:hypothetical protein